VLDSNPQGTKKKKRTKDGEGGEEVGCRQRSVEELRRGPLLLHRRQQEIMMMKLKLCGEALQFIKGNDNLPRDI
jgi:hypothetical protein